MNCLDLTHTIAPGMPVYPGTEPPQFTRPCTIARDGFNEHRLALFSHTGTHLDAPAHVLAGAPTLDRLPPENFCGPAVVVDVSNLENPEITPDILAGLPGDAVEFIIFYTGWCHKWGRPDYFNGFPVPTLETARLLAERGLKGVGVDAISVDPVSAVDLAVHKVLLGRGVLVIENLTNLQQLVGKQFTLYCFPLKIEAGDGSPVRAVAVLDEIAPG